MKKVKVLFVCLGNICRSPLGAAIMKKRVRDLNLADFIEVDSCGTSNYHIGDGADPRTIANARKNGVAIEHCARQLTAEDLDRFDYIFAMDKSNYQNIMRLANGRPVDNKVMLLREFDPKGRGEVPDPYYGDERLFQEVFDIVNRSVDAFLDHIRKDLTTA
jgi:protein-tyrosine phosphatase